MRGDPGQATVEWMGLVVLAAVVFGVLVAFVPAVDGRSYGALLLHRIVCAARGGCDDGDAELAAAYGAGDAELVRRLAPGLVYEPGTLTLPVDFRRCREHACADTRDDPDLDVHRALRGGAPATAFTHVVRSGGETFVQYWLYYPDSTTGGPAKVAWDALSPPNRQGQASGYPGFHLDDWESYQVRIDAAGNTTARASAHHGYQGCKEARCANRWGSATGWTRVSRGSHAGHLPLGLHRRTPAAPWTSSDRPLAYGPQYPSVDRRERTSTSPGLRLVPLERVDPRAYRPRSGITPPWRKRVYTDPRSDSTS
jgi:hypothetical protein